MSGSGCAAIGGLNANHAILGASEACIATHPSDMAVAMRALDASVETVAPSGASRSIAIAVLHRLPERPRMSKTMLEPGELITAVTLPKRAAGVQLYRKVRERASYAFATVSVALIAKDRGGPASPWTGLPSGVSRTSLGVSNRPSMPSPVVTPQPIRSPTSCSPAPGQPNRTPTSCHSSDGRSRLL